MWYPEESVAYCTDCEHDVPAPCFWRRRGAIIGASGLPDRTWVLYSVCPGCGMQRSVGLEGPPWFRFLYGWIWAIRYPHRRPPLLEPIEQDADDSDYCEERRAVGQG